MRKKDTFQKNKIQTLKRTLMCSLNLLLRSFFFHRYFSTLNSQLSIQKGFTLVELLVVMAIFVTVGGIIISTLFISLRGSSKSEAATVVKQNGNFALSQMINMIRFADTLNSPAACVPATTTSSITITSLTDGGQTTYSCPAGTNTAIASNSAALIDTNAVQVSSCSFTCTQTAAGAPPRISIQFTLTSRNAGNVFETQSTIPFQTSVIMRNAGP